MKHPLIYTAILVLSFGCSDDAERGDPAATSGPGHGQGVGDNAGEGGPAPFVPEDEIQVALQVPQGGERYVFVVSTGLDAVVRIDAVTLKVDLIEVGGSPTLMRTLPAQDALIVINSGTQDFSLVRTPAEGGEATVTTLDAPTAVNRLEVTQDGAHAVAWFEPEGDELGELQQVLVLNLSAGEEAVYPVGVGFHPLSVTFQEGGPHCYVVTEDGVSPIDMAALTGPSFVTTVAVTPDPGEPLFDREVLITPDGSTAVVRRGGVNELRIVDLDTSDTVEVALDGAPTDVDLSRNGEEALVVIRDEVQQLVRIPLDAPDELEIIDLSGTPAGLVTLTRDGKKALLHTTLPGHEWLAVLTLETGDLEVHTLKKGVRSVAPAPDSQTVLVVHDKAEGAPVQGEELEDFIDKSHAYSVVDVTTGFAKLELLEDQPGEVAMTPDGLKAYVLIPAANGAHGVDEVDLRAMLATPIALGSPPRHAVYIPQAERVAVSQEHPVGRITFISTQTGDTETVTGFELNGLIE